MSNFLLLLRRFPTQAEAASGAGSFFVFTELGCLLLNHACGKLKSKLKLILMVVCVCPSLPLQTLPLFGKFYDGLNQDCAFHRSPFMVGHTYTGRGGKILPWECKHCEDGRGSSSIGGGCLSRPKKFLVFSLPLFYKFSRNTMWSPHLWQEKLPKKNTRAIFSDYMVFHLLYFYILLMSVGQ